MDKDSRLLRVTVAPDAAGQRLDKWLAGKLPELSRARLQKLLRDGMVARGGLSGPETLTESSRRIKPGELYFVTIPAAAPATPRGEAIPLDILFEDDDLIVIAKPAGLVVHPAPGNPDRTLVNALIEHCGQSLSGIGGVKRPGIVHRLDKETSGAMVVAKNDRAHQLLAAQFAVHSIERAYSALVWGVPFPVRGEISGNIGRSRHNRKKMAVVGQGGKPALTRYRIERNFNDRITLLTCRLETGRTHQIRVHLSSRGHPLLGDALYGSGQATRANALPPVARHVVRSFQRQALHARLLGFAHPRTGETMRFEAPPPADFAGLLQTLRETFRTDSNEGVN